MNCKIPFTKDIEFEKKIYEITSISLEHEIKVEESILKGNFIVAGDFRSHEVSVNKEAFSYILPFEIDLAVDIDPETIEFMIDDFTYETVDNNILRVNIDFNVIGSKLEKEVEEETIFRSADELFLEEDKEEEVSEPEEEKNVITEVEESVDDLKEKIVEDNEENRDEVVINKLQNEEKITSENEETIINSISGTDDNYATYHIHMVSDGESIETICTMYNSNMSILADYNDISNLNSGDKLIIPDKNE